MGGQDATEAFEDVGHSDEAREILEKLLIGDLKRVVSCLDFLLSSYVFPFPPFTASPPSNFLERDQKKKREKKKTNVITGTPKKNPHSPAILRNHNLRRHRAHLGKPLEGSA